MNWVKINGLICGWDIMQRKNGIVVVGAWLGVACTCSFRVRIAVIPSAEESLSLLMFPMFTSFRVTTNL